MLLRRFTAHIRQENWFAVVLDLLVVVVGLFLGLQIDNWWEGRKEAKLEVAYIIEINEDLDLDKASLQLSIVALEEIVSNMVFLLEQSVLTTPSATVADLNRRFISIHSMPTFIPVSRSYSNLTGSGDLRLIRSRSLKSALADYYAASELTGLVQTTHELELVETFQPYVIEYFDYAAVAPSRGDSLPIPPPVDENLILDVLATRQFRNIMVQKWNIASDLLNQHSIMLQQTDELLEMLR